MTDGADSTNGSAVPPSTVQGTAAAPGRTAVEGLTVEHRTDPLGVDAARPRFGWRTTSPVRGRRQTAYRILVASTPRDTEDRPSR